MTTVIPEGIQRFIFQKINSVAQLEALLLFHADPQLEGRVSIIARRLYISDQEVAEILQHLLMKGFLAVSNEGGVTVYTYQPVSSEITIMVEQLADLYARFLVPVTNIIHSQSKNKIQKFADAFWIRKD